ncbi:hypothetical protein [Candidatus Arsenophonus triatominarum]|uniref:hypothetical protein n=1 Tax=Candidatus Arsenophonus triatominarum TaxID=57911 RepID=UPI00164FF40A|nr:hypothetical protein [Candidatus Arsenophonus triatominarum]
MKKKINLLFLLMKVVFHMTLHELTAIARRLNFDYSICIKNRSSIVHPVSIFLRLA